MAAKHPGLLSELGRKGGRQTASRHPGKASEWGRLGGRPRKPSLSDLESVVRGLSPEEGGDPPAGAPPHRHQRGKLEARGSQASTGGSSS